MAEAWIRSAPSSGRLFRGNGGRLPDQAGRAQRIGDLDVRARLQGQQGRANRRVVEDATGDEAMLERDRAFHVRPAVIDGAGHRQQPVMDGAGPGIVLGLAGGDELDQRLGARPP